jgi:DNA polymerase-3 subunit epsilon
VTPPGTLAERTAEYLREGPRPPLEICHDVLGLPQASRTVAERLVLALLGADPRFAFDVDGRWSAVAEPGLGSLPLAELRFAVVDVETTGMSARHGDRMTEVAVVHVDGERGRVEVAFESLLNPGVPIPPRITMLTGIDDALVARAPRFEEVADHVLAALSGRVFVAHNVRFDWAFVRAEVERACGMAPRVPRLCTVRLSRALVPELERRDLDTVRFFFGIETDRRHRAAGDALVTAAVLQRLLARAEDQGIATWHALKLLAP